MEFLLELLEFLLDLFINPAFAFLCGLVGGVLMTVGYAQTIRGERDALLRERSEHVKALCSRMDERHITQRFIEL